MQMLLWIAYIFSLAVLICCASMAEAVVTVTLNPHVRYQTIRGWSCNPWYPYIAPKLRDQLLDEAINELGLTRVRWQPPNGNRADERSWEFQNDDGDPDHINWAGFATREADRQIETWVVPFKQRVEANGDPFELWISPSFFNSGSTGAVPAWLFHSPGEYAEYAMSYLLYLKQKYGIEATHYVICNEAGNDNPFTPEVLAEIIKVLGAKLKAAGFRTKIQFPEGVNAHVSWNYIKAVRNDHEIWQYIGLLSYHWYGRNNQEAMAQIYEFARQMGIDTAQTEFMGLTLNHLYDDLTIGGVSYWCIYGLAGPGQGGHNFRLSLTNTSFTRGPQFWNFRQVMHYVRPGAVRIEATSDEPALRPLAFVRNGKITVVLINNIPPHQSRTVVVNHLPPGEYGVCQSVNGQVYQELGVRSVDTKGSLTVEVPPNSVLTIYPYLGKNLPPTVTDWRAKPEYLTLPSNRITLSASAQDPELDTLSYSWAVTQKPPKANVTLSNPHSATTTATGLTEPGQYVFTVSIHDGHNTVQRDVVVNVYRDNQPPIIFDVHNRLPVWVTLPQSETELRGSALDLESDPLTFRWRILKQPEGATAVLETPNEPRCKLSHLTVAGDYVVQFEVSDPTHTVSTKLTITVQPENHAPVIEHIAATPNPLTLPDSATYLWARTSDPDGDTLTHWWRIKSSPQGAHPSFTRQGWRETKVSGLTVPGKYIFSLTVVDRTKFTVREVTVTVLPETRK